MAVASQFQAAGPMVGYVLRWFSHYTKPRRRHTIGFVELDREELASLCLLPQLLFQVITSRRQFIDVCLGSLQRLAQLSLEMTSVLHLSTRVHQTIQ